MQCPTCGATLPNDAGYCYNCGARLTEATSPAPVAKAEVHESPTLAALGWQENTPAAPPPLPTPQWSTSGTPPPSVPPLPGNGGLYSGTGWTEFSGGQTPPVPTAGAESAYPPASPMPGASGYNYGPSGNYPYMPNSLPGSMPPYFVPPVTPAPKRRGRVAAIAIIVSLMVLLVIFGSVFVGIQIGQSHGGTNSPPIATAATPTASPTADVNQLYQQVTSRTPTYVDPLTNAALSQWAVYEKPTYGCEVKSDGLHVHVKDSNVFVYCTSGRGQFSTFAFQVEMKILSGDGGGLIFRGDTTAGNFYYFHVYPDGSYHIYINQNGKLTTELSGGTASSFVSGFGQENTLTVIAMSSRMDFYMNHKFLIEVVDPTYTNGYLGVLASSSTSPAEVVYTNAQIWQL